MKAIPKTLATGSNNPNKQVSVSVWNAGHNVHGMTRAELQALAASAGQIGYVNESGREGEFVYSTANLSAQVTADTNQGIYVPPTSAPTGASGAWVRKFGNSVNVKWFGAVGDNATNDYAAFAAALAALPDRGGTLYIPQGKYRLGSTLHVKKPIRIIGEGTIGQNPGTVGGVAQSTADKYHGSRLIFDNNLEGIVFHPHTTEDDATLVAANPPNYYTEWSSYRSSIENVVVMSAGYAGSVRTYSAGRHGVRTKTLIHASRVWVIGFQDNGWEVSSSESGTASNYGNADLAQFYACHALHCGNDGFHFEGTDAQVMTLLGCDSSLNGGWGFNDESFLGNTYVGCHVMANNQSLRASATSSIGSFRCSEVNAASTYIGCYIETPTTGEVTSLSAPCVVIGGHMTQDTKHPANSTAFVLNNGQAVRGGISGLNNLNATTVTAGLGREPSATQKVAQWFGTSAEAGGSDQYKLKYEAVWTGIWAWQYRSAIEFMEFPSGQTGFYSSLSYPMSVGFPQGLAMGTVNSAGRLLPAAASAPGSGTYRTGDTIPHSAPAVGGKWGWVCTAGGSPGTWVEFGRIYNQGAAVADLTTTATSGTLPTPDGTVTIANAATPTVTELLEYCVELEAKLETLLARVRAHGLIAT